MGPAMAAAKNAGEEVPTPRVPAEVPRVRPPEKGEVPRPFTFKRLASENEVEEAKLKNEAIEEVAVRYPVFKLFSSVSTPPMSAEPLWTESRAPGVVVPMPTLPEVSIIIRNVLFVLKPRLWFENVPTMP